MQSSKVLERTSSMFEDVSVFEKIVRSASRWTYVESPPSAPIHPFDVRNIHPFLPNDVKILFDNGHYSQSTFEAFKFVDTEVARIAASSGSGYNLMMAAFSDTKPLIMLTPCVTTTDKDEQRGFQFLFAGAVVAIRNPRGHKHSVHDSPDECLDHLGLASLLLRRIQAAGFNLS